MTVLGRGLIFQPALVSLPYTQTRTYNSDTIITLQNILTVQIFHQNYFKKASPPKKKQNKTKKTKQTKQNNNNQKQNKPHTKNKTKTKQNKTKQTNTKKQQPVIHELEFDLYQILAAKADRFILINFYGNAEQQRSRRLNCC